MAKEPAVSKSATAPTVAVLVGLLMCFTNQLALLILGTLLIFSGGLLLAVRLIGLLFSSKEE